MLSLEVVGPGGSLSTVLIATPYRRDASWRVSWQAATATAVTSCDRTATALVHRLGSGCRRHWRSGLALTATDRNFSNSARFCIVFGLFILICLYSAFFISLFVEIRNSRPVNSAYLIYSNACVIFFLVQLLSISQNYPFKSNFYMPRPHPNLAGKVRILSMWGCVSWM